MAGRIAIFNRVVIGVVAAVMVVGLWAEDWLRWFLLGTVAAAGTMALFAHWRQRYAERVAAAGPLTGGPGAPPREAHPLYDPNKVRPYGAAGVFMTSHPAGAVIAAGIVFMAIFSLPHAFLFFLGTLVVGVPAGLILWLRRR